MRCIIAIYNLLASNRIIAAVISSDTLDITGRENKGNVPTEALGAILWEKRDFVKHILFQARDVNDY